MGRLKQLLALAAISASVVIACREKPAESRDSIANPDVPAGMHFVASSRGEVYYWISQTCGIWRNLKTENLVWFPDEGEAQEAGYRPTRIAGCSLDDGSPWQEVVSSESRVATEREAVREGTCTVGRILDGDTMDCLEGMRVRLLLADAPELNQDPFGVLAREALEDMAPPGTELTLELDVMSHDRYGRLLAHLYTPDGRSVGEELVRRGLALVSVYPPNVNHIERFRALAERARTENRGFWSLDGFDCPPSDRRAGVCEEEQAGLTSAPSSPPLQPGLI